MTSTKSHYTKRRRVYANLSALVSPDKQPEKAHGCNKIAELDARTDDYKRILMIQNKTSTIGKEFETKGTNPRIEEMHLHRRFLIEDPSTTRQ